VATASCDRQFMVCNDMTLNMTFLLELHHASSNIAALSEHFLFHAGRHGRKSRTRWRTPLLLFAYMTTSPGICLPHVTMLLACTAPLCCAPRAWLLRLTAAPFLLSAPNAPRNNALTLPPLGCALQPFLPCKLHLARWCAAAQPPAGVLTRAGCTLAARCNKHGGIQNHRCRYSEPPLHALLPSPLSRANSCLTAWPAAVVELVGPWAMGARQRLPRLSCQQQMLHKTALKHICLWLSSQIDIVSGQGRGRRAPLGLMMPVIYLAYGRLLHSTNITSPRGILYL